MKLSEYRVETGQSQAAIARRCTAVGQEIFGGDFVVLQQEIARIEGGKVPNRRVMQALYLASDGRVDGNDVFGLDPARLEERRQGETAHA